MLRLPAPAPASSPLLSFAMGNICGLAGLWQIGSPTPGLTFGWAIAALFAYWPSILLQFAIRGLYLL